MTAIKAHQNGITYKSEVRQVCPTVKKTIYTDTVQDSICWVQTIQVNVGFVHIGKYKNKNKQELIRLIMWCCDLGNGGKVTK